MAGRIMLSIHSIDTILTIIVITTTMFTAHSTTMLSTVMTRDILTPPDILTTLNILTIQDIITSSIPTTLALLDTIKTSNKKKRRSLYKFFKNLQGDDVNVPFIL